MNVLAVELHQNNSTSTDLGFDLELTAFKLDPEALLKILDLESVKAFLEAQGVPLPEDLLNPESTRTNSTVPEDSSQAR